MPPSAGACGPGRTPVRAFGRLPATDTGAGAAVAAGPGGEVDDAQGVAPGQGGHPAVQPRR